MKFELMGGIDGASHRRRRAMGEDPEAHPLV